MSNLIDTIENDIYEKSCEAHGKGESEPSFRIVFSPEGYNRARAEKSAHIYFDARHGMGGEKFMGYPYEVNVIQEEEFKVTRAD
mgnify:CR=1 FL=1